MRPLFDVVAINPATCRNVRLAAMQFYHNRAEGRHSYRCNLNLRENRILRLDCAAQGAFLRVRCLNITSALYRAFLPIAESVSSNPHLTVH